MNFIIQKDEYFSTLYVDPGPSFVNATNITNISESVIKFQNIIIDSATFVPEPVPTGADLPSGINKKLFLDDFDDQLKLIDSNGNIEFTSFDQNLNTNSAAEFQMLATPELFTDTITQQARTDDPNPPAGPNSLILYTKESNTPGEPDLFYRTTTGIPVNLSSQAGDPFNQLLNTFNDVTFNSVKTNVINPTTQSSKIGDINPYTEIHTKNLFTNNIEDNTNVNVTTSSSSILLQDNNININSREINFNTTELKLQQDNNNSTLSTNVNTVELANKVNISCQIVNVPETKKTDNVYIKNLEGVETSSPTLRVLKNVFFIIDNTYYLMLPSGGIQELTDTRVLTGSISLAGFDPLVCTIDITKTSTYTANTEFNITDTYTLTWTTENGNVIISTEIIVNINSDLPQSGSQDLYNIVQNNTGFSNNMSIQLNSQVENTVDNIINTYTPVLATDKTNGDPVKGTVEWPSISVVTQPQTESGFYTLPSLIPSVNKEFVITINDKYEMALTPVNTFLNDFFANLLTSDPNISGQLWNDSGTLKISSGP